MDSMPKCESSQHYYHELTRSCYAITPLTSDWKKARTQCLKQGGDLAHFTKDINFMDMLRYFNPSLGTAPTNQTSPINIWFKWYSWDGKQREAQEYGDVTERFACEIYDNGPVPAFARCHTPTSSSKAQGLCVLPPMLRDFSLPQYQELKCPAKVVNVNGYSTTWNVTNAGVTAQLSCPGNLTGIMYWKCGSDGQWETPVPDTSGCTNPVVTESVNNANQQLEGGKDPSETLDSLSKEISSTTLASGNLGSLDDTMKLAITKQEELLNNISDPNTKETSSKSFTGSIMDLSDVIMSSPEAFWGLDLSERFLTINEIQKNIDNSLYILAVNLFSDPIFQRKNRTLAIQAENRRRPDYADTGYFISLNSNDHIILPPGFQYLTEEAGEKIQLSFVAYTEFQKLLHGDSFALFEDEWIASENSPENRPQGLREVVNTFVLGATLGQPNASISFGGNLIDAQSCTFDDDRGYVEITLKTLNSERYQSSNKRCAFWNVTTQSWSDEGCCKVPNSDDTVTQCRCNHLTNFAVIMDINGIFANKTVPALDYITVIGGSISIFCLMIAIFIFFWVRTLRKEFRFHIRRNLCISMLLAQTLLLFGLDTTQNAALCTAIAVFLHLFFLCAFGWMLVEGLFLYFLITKVFDGSGPDKWQAYVIGLGLPVLIVFITISATQALAYFPDGGSTTCWLSVENGAIWAFAGPVAAVIMVNTVFLIMALRITCKVHNQNRAIGKKKAATIRQIFGAFTLTFVLGITWIFGFLYLNETTIALAYVFTVLNSLQGLFVFIALCVLNKQVRNDFKRQLISTEMVQRLAGFFNIDIMKWRSSSSTQRTNAGSSSAKQNAQTSSLDYSTTNA